MFRLSKKITILLCSLAVSTGTIFAEQGFNLAAGIDFSTNIILKPYLGINANADYEFSNELALALGGKGYWNITQNGNESYLYGGPYILLRYKYFITGGGIFFNPESGALVTPYTVIGGAIPIWQAGKGKIGFDFGLEGWLSIVDMTGTSSSDNETNDSLSDALGTIFSIIFGYPKLFFGVQYFLPL